MTYDPTIFLGTARFYTIGRPPYSTELVPLLTAEAGLDGTGRLLDVGCGPGTLTLDLAPLVDGAVGLDPDAEMLAEGARRAAEAGLPAERVRWVQARAEELPGLDLGTFRLVTFGQSFQWTDRERVAEAVHDLLEPGGTMAMVVHTVDGRPEPPSPGHPPIPHDDIRLLIRRYLGDRRRAGQGFSPRLTDRYEDAITRTRFGPPRIVFVPGRPDLVRDVDEVVAGYHSMSYAAPHLFGERLDAFDGDLRALLRERSPDGLFWDWPGDTEVVLSRKAA
ncbi:MAG TPA: class I SAM-dependent methyltransferase [Acidimicrobiales bacterium]